MAISQHWWDNLRALGTETVKYWSKTSGGLLWSGSYRTGMERLREQGFFSQNKTRLQGELFTTTRYGRV